MLTTPTKYFWHRLESRKRKLLRFRHHVTFPSAELFSVANPLLKIWILITPVHVIKIPKIWLKYMHTITVTYPTQPTRTTQIFPCSHVIGELKNTLKQGLPFFYPISALSFSVPAGRNQASTVTCNKLLLSPLQHPRVLPGFLHAEYKNLGVVWSEITRDYNTFTATLKQHLLV
jgi:hypothetical protein